MSGREREREKKLGERAREEKERIGEKKRGGGCGSGCEYECG